MIASVSSRGRSSGRKCPPPLTVVISTPGISMRSCSRSTARAPMLVAPNEKDRDFDAPIVLGRGLPALGISGQARESAVMPGAIPDKIHFFQKRGRNAVRIGNAAAKHRVHDE